MVVAAMVRRLVHGYLANAAITCSKMEQIAQIICIYQIKVVPLQYGFSYLNWIYGELAPIAAIARGVLLYIWLKKLSILRKINFFLKKKWKKFAHVKKKQYLCTRFRKGNKSKWS